MTDEIVYPLRSWLDNAGIVGLTRILNPADYHVNRFDLTVEPAALNDFTTRFFDFFVTNYGKFTYYSRIIDKEDRLKELRQKTDITESDVNELADWFDHGIKDAMLGSGKTYGQVADFLHKKYHDDFDLIAKAKDCKTNRKAIALKKKGNDLAEIKNNLYALIDKCLVIIDYLKQSQPAKYYPAKYIGFRIIAKGWNKTSFLDVANLHDNGEDIYENFDNFFIKPIQQYLQSDHSHDEYSCAVCNRPIAEFNEKKKISFPITYMNSMGYNFGAKTSNGWNFQNDLYICPICHLLYACVPAGFTYNMSANAKGIFVNESLSVSELKKANDAIFNETLINLSQNQSISDYRMFTKSFEKKFADAHRYPLANVQIITYDDAHGYNFKIISNLASVVLNQASNDSELLESLQPIGIKNYNGEFYYSIFDVIMQRIFNNTVLDSTIYTMERLFISQDQRIRFSVNSIKKVLHLNSLIINELFKEKGEQNMSVDSEQLRKLSHWGFNARQSYKKKGNEKKAQTLAYKMLSALRVGDTSTFMDLLLNAYLYLGSMAPRVFVENQNNREIFTQYGYAFVAGLIDNGIKKEN